MQHEKATSDNGVSDKGDINQQNASLYLKNTSSSHQGYKKKVSDIVPVMPHDLNEAALRDLTKQHIKMYINYLRTNVNEREISIKSDMESGSLVTSDYINEFQISPTDNVTVGIQRYYPNFGGTQVNIQNLHLDISDKFKKPELDGYGFLDNIKDATQRNKEYMLLLVNEKKNIFPSQKAESYQNANGKLKSIIQQYYNNNYSGNPKLKGKADISMDSSNYQPKYEAASNHNSPMLIKLLRNEEL